MAYSDIWRTYVTMMLWSSDARKGWSHTTAADRSVRCQFWMSQEHKPTHIVSLDYTSWYYSTRPKNQRAIALLYYHRKRWKRLNSYDLQRWTP